MAVGFDQSSFGTASEHSSGFSDSGFTGDVLNVFRLPASGDVVSFWRLRFAGADQAAALLSSIRSDPLLMTAVDGRDVVVVADTRSAPPSSFIDTLVWQPAPPEDTTASESSAAGLPGHGAVVCGRIPH